jgi:NAD(P)-dependent dehydrogenase (short-subunit alcohol dehydrogenase family)
VREARLTFQKQGGENYNKWHAYGQSKTANMLMALSLAEKLGAKGLRAFSLHPGVIGTNLGGHLDWAVDIPEMSRLIYMSSPLGTSQANSCCRGGGPGNGERERLDGV